MYPSRNHLHIFFVFLSDLIGSLPTTESRSQSESRDGESGMYSNQVAIPNHAQNNIQKRVRGVVSRFLGRWKTKKTWNTHGILNIHLENLKNLEIVMEFSIYTWKP